MSLFRETTRAFGGMGLRRAQSSRILPMCAVACSLVLCSCGFLGGKKKAPTTQMAMVPPPDIEWSQAPVTAPPVVNKPVKEGAAPLVYMVEADAYVRVVDQTDNVELLSMPVLARQIVAVNPDLGVQVGGATMRPMRLARDHRYGIYILNTQENISRTGRVRSGTPYSPAPMPGRQP